MRSASDRAGFANGLVALLNSSLVAAVLLVLVIGFAIAAPAFISSNNVLTLLQSVAVIAVLAIGQTFVIITAGIDLSQGAVIGLTGILGAGMMGTGGLGGILLGIVVALLVGAGVGLVNGLLTAYTKVPAFIVTLGTLSIASGAALLVTGGQPIYQLPPIFNAFGTGALGIFPDIILVSIVLAIIGQIVLGRTRFGRSIYAIGSNPRAATLSGLPVRRNIVLVYTMSGFLSAIGGVLLTAYVNSALPTAGENYELDSIAAVVIGGGSLFGGQGTVWASMFGVLLIGVLANGTDLIGLSNYAQTVILGCVVIGAVYVDSFRKRVAV
ncbi:MAG TPA: ABC transporter permease [Acidisoma sp.]|uniref:ABC transporter permease n=1 Tax=Acidisoma sp. TaxID=1872115 RepID=UPI002C59ACC7|nr:ABC transporter permease [Acidisoma sp.]HTI03561.1 ABC transporter permease [Acidisoma sp.]